LNDKLLVEIKDAFSVPIDELFVTISVFIVAEPGTSRFPNVADPDTRLFIDPVPDNTRFVPDTVLNEIFPAEIELTTRLVPDAFVAIRFVIVPFPDTVIFPVDKVFIIALAVLTLVLFKFVIFAFVITAFPKEPDPVTIKFVPEITLNIAVPIVPELDIKLLTVALVALKLLEDNVFTFNVPNDELVTNRLPNEPVPPDNVLADIFVTTAFPIVANVLVNVDTDPLFAFNVPVVKNVDKRDVIVPLLDTKDVTVLLFTTRFVIEVLITLRLVAETDPNPPLELVIRPNTPVPVLELIETRFPTVLEPNRRLVNVVLLEIRLGIVARFVTSRLPVH
jgi:hypothetical protein